MLNPFENWTVGDPWDSGESDVPEIGRNAFEACLKALDKTTSHQRTTSVLLYGEPGSGKTHLIRRLRRQTASRALFVYIRLSTSPNMIWRHLRRRLAGDLLRPAAAGASQLYDLLLRRLAMPGSQGALLDEWKREVPDGAPFDEPAFARALDAILHRIPAPLLAELPIFRHFDGEHHLTRDIAQALHYLVLHPGDPLPGAWLRGDSLPQDELDRLRISTRESEDRDPEDRARETVLALARFAGSRMPMILCLDQIEALETTPGDHAGLAALGRTVSTLHDETANIVIVSCIQTSFRDVLRRSVSEADFARMAEVDAQLLRLNRSEAARLLHSRLAQLGEPYASMSPGLLWPLQEADFAAVFDAAGLATARRILSGASERFEQIVARRAPRAPVSTPQFLESEWQRRMDEAAQAVAAGPIDEILSHGIQSLAALTGRRWTARNRSGDIDLELTTPEGNVEVSFCNQRNMNSLAARLRHLKGRQSSGRPARLVVVRDPRLPISPGARAARRYLDELHEGGARVVHPSLEALAALEALRRLLADAKSGDLTCEGSPVEPKTVEEWIAAHLPGSLDGFLNDLGGPASATDGQDAVRREDLLALLNERCVLPVSDAARELAVPPGQILQLIARSPELAGLLHGPPPVLYRLVAAVPKA